MKNNKEADTLKMTYFNNINHQYNRVIFEFTDEEKQAAGFHKTSKEPAILEILRLLNRIVENDLTLDSDKKYHDFFNKIKNNLSTITGVPVKLIDKYREDYSSALSEDIKTRNLIRLDDLQRKKDAWKAKALRLIDFLNNKDKLIERLLRENKHNMDIINYGE